VDVWVITGWIENDGGVVVGVAQTLDGAKALTQQHARNHGRTIQWNDPVNEWQLVGRLSERDTNWTGPILWDDLFMLERFTVDAPIPKRQGAA
jgi:hypothetical protein